MAQQLSFEQYTDDEINIILRDLSESENLNVKQLFDDTPVEQTLLSSSAQRFIQNNINKNIAKAEKRDYERLNYFNDLSNFRSSLFSEIPNFETDNGKQKFKLKLLKLAYEKKLEKHIINLYLQVLNDQYDKSDAKTMKRVAKFMNKIDYKKLQFEKLSNELHPLDFYNEHPKVLDEWQRTVISLINQGKSILITAPTSCGKTWLSIYPGVIGKSILFIVPTDALVFQVGSLFNKFTDTSPILMTNEGVYGNNPKIVVGTPKKIEDLLPVVGKSFDIVVFDEIHNLNDGELQEYYERLLKIYADIPVLGLSATIGNPYQLVEWIEKFHHQDVNLVSYSTRFLNLQRKVFSGNKLINIHPMACLTIDDINADYLSHNLPMTPPDCVQLYKSLHKVFPDEMEELSVANFFPQDNRRLSLDDSREYEAALKTKLVELKDNHRQQIEEIISKYYIETEMGDVNLYNLFKEIKTKNLIPCIVFQMNTGYCREVFVKLVGYLEKLEALNYPYHYENLEFRQDAYFKAEEEAKKYKEGIKVEKGVYNARQYVEDKVDKFREDQLAKFTTDFQKKIERQLNTIKKSDHPPRIKNTQIHNLRTEFETFMKTPSLKYVDIFQKHPDFCLNADSPMSADKIREIKRTIKSKMNIDVSYTNVFMQGLKRGLGIYTKHMPPIYNMIVQRYAQNGELGFVVADDRLALGINMPFRSTCILGYKTSCDFEIHKYKQMIGRSGRRGKDAEGHIIFANVDWKHLMKSELADIVSPYKHILNYNVVNKFTNHFDDNIPNIYDPEYRMDNSESMEYNTEFFPSECLNKILWKLREYNEKSVNLCKALYQFDMDMRVSKSDISVRKTIDFVCNHIFNETDRELITNVLKARKVTDDSYRDFIVIKEFLRVVMEINNTLANSNSDDFQFTFAIEHLSHTFNTIKKIVLNSNDLN